MSAAGRVERAGRLAELRDSLPVPAVSALPVSRSRRARLVARTAECDESDRVRPHSWAEFQRFASQRGITADRCSRPRKGVQARWSADGQELFYLTLEGQLIAVPIALRPDASTLRPGAAVPLFRAKVGAVQGISLHNYIVAPDGQRFLLDTMVEEIPAPISVIVNIKGRGE